MKPLLPTLKEKKRYLVYQLASERRITNCEKAVLSHLEENLGLFDAAKAGIIPIRYDQKAQMGVLRCATVAVDKVKAALLLLQTVDKIPVIPRVLGVSGILNKTTRFIPRSEV